MAADDITLNTGSGGSTVHTLADASNKQWAPAVACYATTVSAGANVLVVVTPANPLPVSLASLPALSAGTAVIGHVVVDTAPTTAVTGTFWQATQPVSGTVAVSNTAFAATQSGTWNVGTVTTVSAVTAITNALPAGTNLLGKVGIDQTTQGTTNAVVAQPVRGTLTDRSGTITAGGTSQQVCGTNSTRSTFLLQNLSTGDLWINFTTAAVQSQPSIKVASGATFSMDQGFVSTEAVNVIGATTNAAFVAKEG